jgi:hypothetical protein
MKLKLVYGTQEDIPNGYEALYTEKDGKWHLTGVEGMKTSEDISRLTESLRKEREDHKKVKDVLAKLGGPDLDADALVEKLDEYEELKLRVESGEGGKIDDKKVEELVEQRVQRRLAPVERERDRLKTRNTELETENGTLKGTITRGTVESELRRHATEGKVVTSALDDILDIGANIFEVAEDGAVVTRQGLRNVPAGVTPDVWLSDMKEKRPHWWPASQGGGAGGGSKDGGTTSNPWTKDNWSIEAQAQLVRTDPGKADRMAKAAGVHVGAMSPAS